MLDRIKQAMRTLFSEERPMCITGHDGEIMSVSQQDVREIMEACSCGEDEAMDRLAGYVVDRMEGR